MGNEHGINIFLQLLETIMTGGTFSALLLFIVVIIFIRASVKMVPQQHAWVVERFGKFHTVLNPGLAFIVPFIDRIAYMHSLKEIPLDTPSQVCITKDNTQLTVDGLLYFQVTDARLASYGSSNYVIAISQLAQTTLRSVIGRLELDRIVEERNQINTTVVESLDEAAGNWGVKVLRYEIKDLTPPQAILLAMQSQITAEREKRALIAQSEGRKQEQINIATGQREGDIARSEGERQSAINRAQGEAEAIVAIANATAEALRTIGQAIHQPGGSEAINARLAEDYIRAFAGIAKTSNTLVVPGNMSDLASMVSSAMSMVKSNQASAQPASIAAPKS